MTAARLIHAAEVAAWPDADRDRLRQWLVEHVGTAHDTYAVELTSPHLVTVYRYDLAAAALRPAGDGADVPRRDPLVVQAQRPVPLPDGYDAEVDQ